MVRTPLRFDCTGIACSASLIRMTSDVPALTFVTWPKMPSPSSTACPLKTPSTAPLSSSTRWRNGSRSTLRIDETSTRSATPCVFSRMSRSLRFSSSSTAKRCNCRFARRRRAVSSRFSWRNRPRSATDPLNQSQKRKGRSTPTCTG